MKRFMACILILIGLEISLTGNSEKSELFQKRIAIMVVCEDSTLQTLVYDVILLELEERIADDIQIVVGDFYREAWSTGVRVDVIEIESRYVFSVNIYIALPEKFMKPDIKSYVKNPIVVLAEPAYLTASRWGLIIPTSTNIAKEIAKMMNTRYK